jgi:hypothetical protein
MGLFNPLTTKVVKESLQNLALARRGLGKGAPAAIAATRDLIAMDGRTPLRTNSGKRTVEYEWWV